MVLRGRRRLAPCASLTFPEGLIDRSRDWGEGELDLALRSAGCPACRLADETADAVLSWMAKANVREPQTIRNLARAGGLCGLHWAGLLRRTDGRTIRALGRAMDEVARAVTKTVVDGSPSAPACPVCASMARRARGTLEMILGRLHDDGARSGLAASFGLCQSHLVEALALSRNRHHAQALLAIHRRQLDRLVGDLRAAGDDADILSRRIEAVAEKLGGSGAGRRRP